MPYFQAFPYICFPKKDAMSPLHHNSALYMIAQALLKRQAFSKKNAAFKRGCIFFALLFYLLFVSQSFFKLLMFLLRSQANIRNMLFSCCSIFFFCIKRAYSCNVSFFFFSEIASGKSKSSKRLFDAVTFSLVLVL